MRKRNFVNLHVYASQTVKKCMKPVMVRLKDLLTTVYWVIPENIHTSPTEEIGS